MSKESPESENYIDDKHPEIWGICLIVFGILLMLSLFSFCDGNATVNRLGFLGYATAWSLLYLFGLIAYPLSAIVVWIGWKKLCHKPIFHKWHKVLHLSIIFFSLCLLLNVLAETHPGIGRAFFKSVYTEKIKINTPVPYKSIRYNLGGCPIYYLYVDLPNFNLHRLLSNVGISCIFITTFLISLVLLTRTNLSPFVAFFQNDLLPGINGYFTLRKLNRYLSFFMRGAAKIKSFFGTTSSFRIFLPAKSEEKPPEIKRREPSPVIASSFTAKPKTNPLLITSISESPLTEEPLFTKSSTDYRPYTKRQKAIESQKVYNGDFTSYRLPPLDLLIPPKKMNQPSLQKDLRAQAEILEETLLSFGIEAKVGEIHCGPTIISFEVHPATGVKVQKIKALENDIALNLQAKSIRIIAPIPGKAVVGIEIPAPEAREVNFREIVEEYRRSQRNLGIPVLLGKTVSGEHVMADLARMPHCIIAGATGTGKSVCVNTIVMSMLLNCKPDELKLILVDPKKVELFPYTRLPHMLAPVITEPQGVTAALKWLVAEMEKRYEILKLLGLRNIATFNHRKRNKEAEEDREIEIPEKMYYIVCIIDELADLMMLSSNEIEMPIARIAQMARAVGIHLILATQRPSREVITGLIKANFPTRIAFKVASRVNSQIILDEIGAESLLGNGDMLFMPPGAATLIRTQGCFTHDRDIQKVVDFICEQAPPNYLIDSFDIMGSSEEEDDDFSCSEDEEGDPLYRQALDLVLKTGTISTTFIQRKLKIGYARAAGIMDRLEDRGIISGADGAKPRKLLSSPKSDEDDFSPSHR